MKKVLTLLLAVLSATSIYSSDKPKTGALTFHAYYKGDFLHNFHGGLSNSSSFNGLAAARLEIDTERLSWWRGGSIVMNIANSHGNKPSQNIVGDFQGVVNTEAGYRSFFQELYISQHFAAFTIKFGIQELNTTFASNPFGDMFINSSFGVHPAFGDNLPSSIYPYMGLGLTGEYKITDVHHVKAGAFDGDNELLVIEPARARLPFSGKNGIFCVAEYHLEQHSGERNERKLHVGSFCHNHKTLSSKKTDSLRIFRYGFYAVVNQRIAAFSHSRHLDVFAQVSVSPQKNIQNPFYVGLGAIYAGYNLFGTLGDLGIAIGYAKLQNVHNSSYETVIELTNKIALSRFIYIQPDLQYIINPSGYDYPLKNSFTGIVRMLITI